MLTAYLKKSTAYFDGRRVLIDGGYLPGFYPGEQGFPGADQADHRAGGGRALRHWALCAACGGREARSTVEDTLKELAAHGVDRGV